MMENNGSRRKEPGLTASGGAANGVPVPVWTVRGCKPCPVGTGNQTLWETLKARTRPGSVHDRRCTAHPAPREPDFGNSESICCWSVSGCPTSDVCHRAAAQSLCGHVADTIPEWALRHRRVCFRRIESGSVAFPGNKAPAARRYFLSRNARAAAMAACRWLIPDLNSGSISA